MNTRATEVLVVGSGFGAAAPALRLSKQGFRVLMIEKGKDIKPDQDFKQTSDPKYLLTYLKGMSEEHVSFTYAEALGGGSGFYEMVSLRAPSKVFDQVDNGGNRLWPGGVDRVSMDPYYSKAEDMLNVVQIGVGEIPKSGVVFSQLMKNLGYSCDRAPYAVKGCVGSGYCVSGCIFGAKQSLLLNYLPQAREAGVEILTDVEALSIRPLSTELHSTRDVRTVHALPYRYEILCRNSATNELFMVRTKILILGGGTVGTATLLLKSREHLRSLSSHVGKNICYNGSVKAAGLLPEGCIEGDMLSGRSHPGMISYQFFDSLGITISSAKPLPLQVVTTANLCLEQETRSPRHWGQAHVDLMRLYRRRMIVLYALGLTPPSAEIVQDGRESFKPSLTIDEGLRNYYRQTKTLLNSIFIKNNCKPIECRLIDHEGKEFEDIHFGTAHMIGSCRMADRKENGVVNAYGEVFGYPGIFVTDGAAVPTSLAVNSSLTILANAERISDYLVRWFQPSSKCTPLADSEEK